MPTMLASGPGCIGVAQWLSLCALHLTLLFRNLDQLFDLLRTQRRGDEPARYGISHDLINSFDPDGGKTLFRDEIAHSLYDLLWQARILRIMLERRRIGIHPFDRLLVGA